MLIFHGSNPDETPENGTLKLSNIEINPKLETAWCVDLWNNPEFPAGCGGCEQSHELIAAATVLSEYLPRWQLQYQRKHDGLSGTLPELIEAGIVPKACLKPIGENIYQWKEDTAYCYRVDVSAPAVESKYAWLGVAWVQSETWKCEHNAGNGGFLAVEHKEGGIESW